jgi:hypothetical protein
MEIALIERPTLSSFGNSIFSLVVTVLNRTWSPSPPPKIRWAMSFASSISSPSRSPVSGLRDARPFVFSSTATTSFPLLTRSRMNASAVWIWAVEGRGAKGG